MVQNVKPKIGSLYKIRALKPEMTIVRVNYTGNDMVKYQYISSNQPRFCSIIGGEFQCDSLGFDDSFEPFISPSEIWKSLNEV